MKKQSEEINIGIFTTYGKSGNGKVLENFTREITAAFAPFDIVQQQSLKANAKQTF